MIDFEVFIGYDPRLARQWKICARSLVDTAALPLRIRPIGIRTLARIGWYNRPTETLQASGGPVWLVDKISKAPMSTEFALARFFVPFVAQARWAVYCDSDFLFRADIARLVELADSRYAVQVVQHEHAPAEAMKMDGQKQSSYARKNWSSLILWNLSHAGCMTGRLNKFQCNTEPGLWLQQFRWLKDHEIGALPPEWNWIEGARDIRDSREPNAVHFTAGTPDMSEHQGAAYTEEWLGYMTAREVEQDLVSTCRPESSTTE